MLLESSVLAYDGTTTPSNVRFYKGYRNNAEAAGTNAPRGLAAVWEVTSVNGLVTGAGTDATFPLVIGNRQDNLRPMDGYLDNFRIWGSKTDNSGVLGLSQLEAVRSADVAIPEPTALASIGLAALALARRPRRS